MLRRPPRSTRTYRRFPYPTLFHSIAPIIARPRPGWRRPGRRAPAAFGQREQAREQHIFNPGVGAQRLAPELRLDAGDAAPFAAHRLVGDRLRDRADVANHRRIGGNIAGHEAAHLMRNDTARRPVIDAFVRPEERRVGNEWGSKCRCRWWQAI